MEFCPQRANSIARFRLAAVGIADAAANSCVHFSLSAPHRLRRWMCSRVRVWLGLILGGEIFFGDSLRETLAIRAIASCLPDAENAIRAAGDDPEEVCKEHGHHG